MRLRWSLSLRLLAIFALAGPGVKHALAQADLGELRVTVMDQAGLPVRATADLVSEANQYRRRFEADAEGRITAKRLPFGLFTLEVKQPGFQSYLSLVDIRSAIPKELKVTVGVAALQTTVEVSDNQTLIDPYRAGMVNRIGSESIQDRRASQPGRSMSDLVKLQPGWVLEANGVLHPRGSEYQTQYVMDGIPLTDNRSAAFVPDFDVEDVQSMSVMTAGFPAEFGRKLGGVIEVMTARDTRSGFHGKGVGYGGNFETAGGFTEGLYGWGANTFTLSTAGVSTDRYLDPPVERNFSNHGTNGDVMAHMERDLGDNDRVGVIFRKSFAKFLVPNEQVQQEVGQRQDRGSFETSGQISYSHIFSPRVIGDLRGMVRDVSADLWSNPFAYPIDASQDRSYRESYVKGTVSAHYGIHELKAGVEGDFASVREALGYEITDPTQFDDDTPASFRFRGHAQDREQGVFVQDLVRLKNLTLSGGIRYDHYGFVVDQGAWSPRAGVAWYVPAADLVFRASYDRVFITPAFENLLLASTSDLGSFGSEVLRLPVQPSHGNYFEAGFTKGFFQKVRLDTNFYRRNLRDYADDDLLLNTGVSFPIAFKDARIQGVEVKVEVPRWGPFSGFVSYSNFHGVGTPPVTGGLFLGDEAAAALTGTDKFAISQDQRNSVQGRVRWEVAPRLWAAFGSYYGSGLPVELEGDPDLDSLTAQYGKRVTDRVNFSAGRVRPSFTLDVSLGAILYRREKQTLRIQADVLNLADRLNVINFASLFSGTALATPRNASVRMQFDF